MNGKNGEAAPPPDGARYAAFLGAVVIGEANFIAVSVSNMELPPLFGAALRFGLASALRWSASATVYAVAAMPVVAAGLGVLMLDQPIPVEVVAGGVLVIAAVYTGAVAPQSGRSAVVHRA